MNNRNWTIHHRAIQVVGGLLASFALLLALGGCDTFLAELMIVPPNRGTTVEALRSDDSFALAALGVDRVERVDVGPPPASIACWIIEPRAQPEGVVVPRGTVFVLHGFGDGPFWMLGKAKTLADHGYRAVVVALRGYAGSTGESRTFGVVERCDLVQVLDELIGRGIATGPIAVWGMSYGAATAIQWAGTDQRVSVVVAVAAFSSMRDVTPHFARMLLPFICLPIDDEHFDRIIDDAGRRGHFNPDNADTVAAMSSCDAAVLVMHGEWDALVPFEQGERIAAAGDERSRFVRLPMRGHIGAWADLDGLAQREGIAWLERWTAGAGR